MKQFIRLIHLTAFSFLCLADLRAASIWVEGEDARLRRNNPHSWYDSVKKKVLSGRNWISNFNQNKEGLVGYQLEVPASGSYTFWIRANHVKSALSYRLNGGSWASVDFKGNLHGAMNIAADNKPDLRFISWVKAGMLRLKKGRATLEFRMHSASSHHGAIDCFCLTTKAWVPSGISKPSQGGSAKSRPADPKDAIWIEGEDADRSTTRPHSWYDSVKTDTLSGQKWLSHFNKEQAASAEYRFEVVEGDLFTFWLRANASAGARLSWSLDEGPYRLVEWKDGRGSMNIANDNKPDMRYISWFKVGQLDLKAGQHLIAFRMDSESHHHGAIDCFTFTRIPFVPSGANRPAVRTTAARPDEWFPFIADDDPFSKDSVIDVSRLVEAPAGKHGFLKRDGARLRFEKAAQPIKFWAIGSAPGNMTHRQMKQAAKWYRKHGVNLVRQHTVIGTTGVLDARGEFDKGKLDRYDRWFASMKEEGVYSTWSVIYPHHGAMLQKHDGYDPAFFAEMDRLDGNRDGNRQAIALNDFVNIDRGLQDIVLKYFRKLLEHRNPYTGLAYKDDPALAVLEFQNESNLFFHTLNTMFLGKAPLFANVMRKRFFAFVKNKYRSKEAVARAWSNKWSHRDKWAEGELGLQGAYHWGSDGPLHEYRGQFRRTGDYIEFLTRVQREYYTRRQKEVRALGFQGVTVTTAWHSGGPAASMANLFCDTAGDMIDRHNYSGGGVGGHVITEGKVMNQTHLDKPGRGLFNLALFQVEDRPFAVSEWIMSPPAPYKAEAAPLFAFYGMGLQGWDASYHFNCSQSRYGDGWPNLSKYASHTPHYMGQFPALAFAVHNNHIREGTVVKARQLTGKELFSGKDVLGQARSAGSHDLKKLAGSPVTPTELFAIGRLTIGFSGKALVGLDMSRYWDQDRKILRSTTGDLLWDYRNRIVEVRSPKTQAIIGFAGGRSFDLPGASVTIKTPFVSLILTPLDNLDLVRSKQILVTALARDKQTGSIYNADWSQLTQVGGPPLLLEPVQARIKLKGVPPRQVRPLDFYGVPKAKNLALKANGSFAIDGTQQTFYYEILR